jgi:hypothetical protein
MLFFPQFLLTRYFSLLRVLSIVRYRVFEFPFSITLFPLIHPTLSWHGIRVAHCKDIVSDKIKTISQRGSKKDFIDLYAVLKMRYSVQEVCDLFKKRFKRSDINFYHVLKSLTFFEDAEQEPPPLILSHGEDWKWVNIKVFFIDNISLFEHELGMYL